MGEFVPALIAWDATSTPPRESIVNPTYAAQHADNSKEMNNGVEGSINVGEATNVNLRSKGPAFAEQVCVAVRDDREVFVTLSCSADERCARGTKDRDCQSCFLGCLRS